MYKWELCGRFEHAETREQAATLLGATDPNEVRFAGYCVKPAKPVLVCGMWFVPRRDGIRGWERVARQGLEAYWA